MECTKPLIIRDKLTAGHMSVPCGGCMACRVNYARDWSQRMMHELKFHEDACFVTLTYNDEHLPSGNTLVKSDVQNFLKRLRKNTGKKVRYYFAGEYGENYERPHYHGIVYGIGRHESREIEQAWSSAGSPIGFVSTGTVTPDSCGYTARYITKKLTGKAAQIYKEKGVIPEFSLMSRRPGLGEDYATTFKKEIINRGYLIHKGSKAPIPRYYRSKVYVTPEEKEIFDARCREHHTKLHQKLVANVVEKGYTINDRDELSQRVARDNIIKGRMSLKRRKGL